MLKYINQRDLIKMILETLKKSGIFSVLTEENLQKMCPLFDTLNFKNDEYIFMESDPADWLFIASKGKVKIVKHSHAGKDIILEVKFPGELFCCAAVLDQKPFPESAQSMEDVSVIRISRKNLLNLMEKYPILKVEVAKYASDKLRDAHEMLGHIASEKVDKRIAAVLVRLSEKAGVKESGYTKIDFQLTRQEIAEMVGTTVETCIRTMSKFQKDGMVKSLDNRILVKPESLKKLLGY